MEDAEDNYLGYLGVLFYSGASLWLASKAIKKGSDSTDRLFLVFWLIGAVLLFSHSYLTVGLDFPILSGYGFDIILAGITVKYNFWPRK